MNEIVISVGDVTDMEAIVRARFTDGVGLRFSSFLRSEESRLRRLLDLRLPDHAI